MKYIVTLLFVFSLMMSSFAAYYRGNIVFEDGKTRTGLIEQTLGGIILFKSSENAEVEKIESSLLKSLTIQGKDEVREYYYLKVYLGWGQKRISDPMWLKVVEKGIATLLVDNTSMSDINGLNKATFAYYYCIRDGEPAAKAVATISTLNNNQTFRAKAPMYFADYPELADKIKSKEYTWKDLQVVVKEYNKWAAQRK